jgi:hypothetical protein
MLADGARILKGQLARAAWRCEADLRSELFFRESHPSAPGLTDRPPAAPRSTDLPDAGVDSADATEGGPPAPVRQQWDNE